MGSYNSFVMDVAVPAEQVAPLAAELRGLTKEWWGFDEKELSDQEMVAAVLYQAEGGDAPDVGYLVEQGDVTYSAGSVRICTTGYGKIGESDFFESLYAEHGATGSVEGSVDDEHYLVILKDGGTVGHNGQVVYPSAEDAEEAVMERLPRLSREQAARVMAALTEKYGTLK